MKETEKAKAYDEALKKIKECTPDENGFVTIYPNEIFPELKDSEDEKVRKWLITQLELKSDVNNPRDLELMILKSITLLENQGKQKTAEWSKEDERICQCLIRDQEKALDDVRNDKYGHSEIVSDLKEMYRERIDWLKSLKERIGE